MARVLLLAATCWLGSVFAALLALGGTTAWAGPGMSRVPAALVAYFAVVVTALAAAVYLVHRGASRLLPADGGRIALVLVFGALQMVTFAFLGFVGLLAFNR